MRPAAHASDVEQGRSAAVGMLEIDRPSRIVAHLERAQDAGDLAARLAGVTWGLAARRRGDPDYFTRCTAEAGAARSLLRSLAERCVDLARGASSYARWQEQTRDAALAAWVVAAERDARAQ